MSLSSNPRKGFALEKPRVTFVGSNSISQQSVALCPFSHSQWMAQNKSELSVPFCLTKLLQVQESLFFFCSLPPKLFFHLPQKKTNPLQKKERSPPPQKDRKMQALFSARVPFLSPFTPFTVLQPISPPWSSWSMTG